MNSVFARVDVVSEALGLGPPIAFITDGEGVLQVVSTAAVWFFNLPPSVLVQKSLLGFVARRDTRRFRMVLKKLVPLRLEPVAVRLRPRSGPPHLVTLSAESLGRSDRLVWRMYCSTFSADLEWPHGGPARGTTPMIWRSALDGGCDFFNDAWLSFTGRGMQQERGDGWAEGVHSEDLDRCVSHYLDHFRRREPFAMEYRLRRHDGVYRRVYDRGVPVQDKSGAFAGFIGSCIDVEEHRSARGSRLGGDRARTAPGELPPSSGFRPVGEVRRARAPKREPNGTE